MPSSQVWKNYFKRPLDIMKHDTYDQNVWSVTITISVKPCNCDAKIEQNFVCHKKGQE